MTPALSSSEAEAVLTGLASVFFQNPGANRPRTIPAPNVEARYRALVEQIPAVVFMAYLDQGIGEAYVSPQIEKSLGYTQAEWLEDPVLWYQHIHPDDKERWSIEAAHMFASGTQLRSAYRVLARDGRVVWFHCEANMIRRPDGHPWFIHGVAFDITELKAAEAALKDERNVLSAILDTVGALVVVLDPEGRIVRFNRACERTTGYSSAEVVGHKLQELLVTQDDRDLVRDEFNGVNGGAGERQYESYWLSRNGERCLISWSTTILAEGDAGVRYVIATGIDITERKRLEEAILEISGLEQRRIGQDLHDGLGQHLTGIAFLSKVLERKLAEQQHPEAAEALKIVNLVNQAIYKTKELSRGLLPVLSDSYGLMSALQQWANEVQDLFRVCCKFECDDQVCIENDAVSNHLYRIAQEAVHNAIKHGNPRNILISLSTGIKGGLLSIHDDGSGIPANLPPNKGMGLSIMRYRANMIGGAFEIKRASSGGTLVTCTFPG